MNTKKQFIELCCQLFSGQTEKSMEQINLERSLNGEEPFLLKEEQLGEPRFLCWLLGFTVCNHSNCEFVDLFKYGLDNDWFYQGKEQKIINVFEFALEDCVCRDNNLYKILSDYYITHFDNSRSVKRYTSFAYATGLTNLDFQDILDRINRFYCD